MTKISSLLLASTLLAVALLAPASATNSDVDKEHRWADQVIDGLLDGDEIWLVDPSGHEFLGIATEGDSESGRAVLLMHGIGVHPNWPDVIYPLRAGLLEAGITSLSIQMPILPNEAEPAAYLPLIAEAPGRVEAAMNSLEEAGYTHVTLVAHSLGAAMAVYSLAVAPSANVDSLVIIGMSPGIRGNENIEHLGSVDLPVLDLYGSNDLDAVLASVGARAAAGKAASESFRQLRVEGANHFFQGRETQLVQQVVDWIEAQSAR